MKNLIKELVNILSTILISITILFILVRLTPGDPVEKILGPEATFEQIKSYRTELGLDKSLLSQYLSYMRGFATGNLGESLFKKEKVTSLLIKHLPATATIAFLSVIISFILGTLIGSLSAFYKNSPWDNILRLFTLVCLAFPIFSLAPVLVLIFSIKLQIFPVSEWGELKHIFLPVMTLVIPLSAVLSRVSRNKYLEEASALWVKVLYAKGMSDVSVFIRIVKVSLPTILNVVAIQLSVVLAGTMITETIYDIPGTGTLLLESISNRDYPVIQGVVVYSTIVYLAVYLTMDKINKKIDPRILS